MTNENNQLIGLQGFEIIMGEEGCLPSLQFQEQDEEIQVGMTSYGGMH